MKTHHGKSVFKGIAIGRICIYKKSGQQIKRIKTDALQEEWQRFQKAKSEAIKQLEQLYKKACTEVGETNAAIFEIHQMMLEDDDYNESVENIIYTQRVNAEYAVAATSDNFSKMFESMDDEYMKGRAADVRDISERIINNLTGNIREDVKTDEKVIIIADDLAPSQTVQLDKDNVLSFVTVHGSLNSHTAILARNMAIPALVQTDIVLDDEFCNASDGLMAVVDGNNGCIYIDPDKDLLDAMFKKKKLEEEKTKLLQQLKGRRSHTIDGKKIKLYANIADIKDLASAIENDASGIGLFRSEFLYLGRDDFPTEQEQFEIYKIAAEMMAGKDVIIRTLDIGADKQCNYMKMNEEENPALGYRAIRICLTQTEIFKTQLRAILRASAYGNISIMYPMITSLWEIKKIKETVEEVKAELRSKGIIFKDVRQGVMIETPAAVMISEELAEEVDFFSIGTNDLTQYTLAIDRQNPCLERFFDPYHPSVMRMIRMTVDNAHKAGIWAGICGELAADVNLTEKLLRMGVDELSVAPGSILQVKKIILETDLRTEVTI